MAFSGQNKPEMGRKMADPIIVIAAEMLDFRQFKRVFSYQCRLAECITPEEAICSAYPRNQLIRVISVATVNGSSNE